MAKDFFDILGKKATKDLKKDLQLKLSDIES